MSQALNTSSVKREATQTSTGIVCLVSRRELDLSQAEYRQVKKRERWCPREELQPKKAWRQDQQRGTRFVKLSLMKQWGICWAAQGDESGLARVLGTEDPLQHETESACLATGHVLRATGA